MAFVGDDATFDCVGSDRYNNTEMTYEWLAYDSDGNMVDSRVVSVPVDSSFSYQTYSNVQLDRIRHVHCVFEGTVHSANATLDVRGVFCAYMLTHY